MTLRLKDFEFGVSEYWRYIGSRSQAVQQREREFPDLCARFRSRVPQHFTREDLDFIIRWKYTDARRRDSALRGLKAMCDDEQIKTLSSHIDIVDVTEL